MYVSSLILELNIVSKTVFGYVCVLEKGSWFTIFSPDTYIVHRKCYFTSTQCQSVSTFESEVRNSLSALQPHSMDSLGHQHRAKKLSPKIALHFKVLCESKATLPT